MDFPISVYLSYFADFSPEQAVELLTGAGLRWGEISEDHLAELMGRGDPEKTGRQFGTFAGERGMTISQGHLSFETGDWLTAGESVETLKKELVLYAAMGVKNAVLHANGGNDLDPELRYARIVENLRKVAEFAGSLGVTVCLENLMSTPFLWTADTILGLIRDAGDKNMGICLDTGHLHLCKGQGKVTCAQSEFIRTAGRYLQALHVVDNDGLGDTHQMPFSARYGVDWKDVMQALQEIRYPGLFNLECLGEQNAPLPIRLDKLEFMQKMCEYMFTDEFLIRGK